MRTLAFTILTMSIALADGQARRSDIWSGSFTAPGLMRAHRIATACKGAIGAIPAIANSPATPNAWPPRAVLSPIAGSIPTTRSPASGAATIDPDTERPASDLLRSKDRSRCRRPGWSLHAEFLSRSTPQPFNVSTTSR